MSHRILRIQKLDFHWEMENPFLFCAHHKDQYPKGNEHQEPTVSLSGRSLGEDFAIKDGFRMYHGTKIPGFPVHPHRGFETVTIVTQGYVDHFDSKGSCGRYGEGDVQWLTTGKGCQHAEMFPLTSMTEDNPLELFQIWLNLPAKDKMCEAEYNMLWSEDIPKLEIGHGDEGTSIVTVINGKFDKIITLTPNQNSYAAKAHNRVGIFMIEMQPKAKIVMQAISKTMNRNLYFYRGDGTIEISNEHFKSSTRIKLDADFESTIINGNNTSYILLLEGEPIDEPVVSHGPFVMNTRAEIAQAFSDYQHTHFGGWPWQRPDPVNPRDSGRFARYIDGRFEKK